MVAGVSGVLLLLLFSFADSQALESVLPSSYSATARNVNGSTVCNNSLSGNGINCTQPNTSVLFDGEIPTLTGLDGNMWASQLLALHKNTFFLAMVFQFEPGHLPIQRTEVVMFNCPEWGIGAEVIGVIGVQASHAYTLVTSCESLVRVCIPNVPCCDSTTQILMPFTLDHSVSWVHLAEVTFYHDNSSCPPSTIITTPPVTTFITPTPPPDTTTPTSPSDTTTPTSPPDITMATSPPDTTTPTPPPDITTPTPPQETVIMHTPLPDTTIATPTPPPNSTQDTTITTPTPPPDTTIAIPSPCITITTPTPPPYTTDIAFSVRINALPTILSVVLSLLFILVCVVAVLLLLWRCYSHHKHNRSPPPHYYEEPGLALRSTAHVASKPGLVLEKSDKLSADVYTAITNPDPHTLAHTKERRPYCPTDQANVYAAITNPDPQSVYTQADTRSRQANHADSAGVYANPDPQSLYTQVD